MVRKKTDQREPDSRSVISRMSSLSPQHIRFPRLLLFVYYFYYISTVCIITTPLTTTTQVAAQPFSLSDLTSSVSNLASTNASSATNGSSTTADVISNVLRSVTMDAEAFASHLSTLQDKYNATMPKAGASTNCSYRQVEPLVRANGTYIVHLTQSVPSGWLKLMKDLLPLIGIEITYTFQNTIDAFTISFDNAAADLPLDLLKRLPFIKSIEEDQILQTHQVEDGLHDGAWGLDRVDQASTAGTGSYIFTKTGKGVHIYVLDGQVDKSHQEFANNGGRADVVYVSSAISTTDCTGHGTHVAGIAAGLNVGIAKEANVHSVVVVGCNENGSVTSVAQAIDWLTANAKAPAVVNMSLGPKMNSDGSYTKSNTLDNAIAAAINSGITFVVAAGNDGNDACSGSPAGTNGVITVGATDAKDQRASFSNYGSCVNLWAPGVNIMSSVPASVAGAGSKPYGVKEGTSQASPFVAGMVALLLQDNPKMSPSAVLAALRALTTTGMVGNAINSDGAMARAPGSVGLTATQRNALYVTLSAPGTAPGYGNATLSTTMLIVIVVCAVGGALLLCGLLFYCCRRRRRERAPAGGRSASPFAEAYRQRQQHLQQQRLDGVSSEPPASPFIKSHSPIQPHRPHSSEPVYLSHQQHQLQQQQRLSRTRSPLSPPARGIKAPQNLAPIVTTNLRTTSDKSPVPEPGTPMAQWLSGLESDTPPVRASTPYYSRPQMR